MTFFRDNLRPFSPLEIEVLVAPVLKEILNRCSPLKVILFGSATTAKFDEYSDLDFIVVLENGDSIKEVSKDLYRIRHQTPVGLDFIVVTFSRFEEMKKLGGVLFVAEHEGKVLYSIERANPK